MSDQGWYQRKLSSLRQQPQQQEYHQPQPVQRYQPQPQPQYQQPPQQVQQVQYQPPPQPPKVTIENLYEAMAFWKGGKAHRDNPDPCPQCGSGNYFTSIQTTRRGPPPAPHCFACGYNDGMFTQGQQATWQS